MAPKKKEEVSKEKDDNKPQQPNDREKEELKGTVKRLESKLYRAHLKKDHIVQGIQLDEESDPNWFTMCFHEEGYKTEREYYYSKDHIQKNVYNALGQEIESASYQSGVLQSKAFVEYNERGARSKIIRVDAENNIKEWSVWEYDEKGYLIAINSFDKDGKFISGQVFTNDERGFKTEQKNISAEGIVSYWSLFKNDKYGHWTEIKRLKPDGSVEKTEYHTYTYDDNGKMIGMDGRLFGETEYVEYKEFEFDEHGNWTTAISFHNKFPVDMVIREITYYGDEPGNSKANLIITSLKSFPYVLEKKDDKRGQPYHDYYDFGKKEQNETEITEEIFPDTGLSADDAKWIAESGSNAQSFPDFRYYVVKNNNMPSCVVYGRQNIEVIVLMKELKANLGAKLIHCYYTYYSDWDEKVLTRYTLTFPNDRYMLHAMQIFSIYGGEYDVPYFISNYDRNVNDIYVSQLMLLQPSDDSGKRDEEFEEELQSYIRMCTLERKPEKPQISMVEADSNGNYMLSTYAVNDDFVIKDLDMNYGYGFDKFHSELMQRFQNETKGLVLFHGEPGTGKTYYIRHLLRKMASNKKEVIYLPPNMVEHILEPKFITFLSASIADMSADGNFCVLLIEDAEPLLASRQEGNRVQGISNLLNMTDGLLNDMLKIQIICTFNVKVKELDPALLRPGRLVARKEFKAMTVLDANRLAKQLGIKHHFTKAATLAEVYSLVQNKNTLLHGVGEEVEKE